MALIKRIRVINSPVSIVFHACIHGRWILKRAVRGITKGRVVCRPDLIFSFCVWVVLLVGVYTTRGLIGRRMQILCPDVLDRGFFKIIELSKVYTVACV